MTCNISHSGFSPLPPAASPGGGGDERGAALLETALAAVPAYRAWRRFDPGPAVPFAQRLARLPALTKAHMRAAGPAGFVPPGRDLEDALRRGEVELVATSGTTGDRVVNVWNQPWWDASERASWQLNATARRAGTGCHAEAILVSPFCAGFPCEDGYLDEPARTLGRFLFLNERSDPATWTAAHQDRMIDELNRFRPVFLEGNPSFLDRLARHILRRGSPVASPALVVMTYENPSVLHRRRIAAAFQCPLASSYGSTETGYVFMECEAGRLHQNTAFCHVDFLPFAPPHGGPAVGRILVSTFNHPWAALLRFDIGDVVRLAAVPCPCGRRDGLTLDAVEGRTVNLTLTPTGIAVTQRQADLALGGVDGLDEYRLEQIAPAAYRVLVVAAPGHDADRVRRDAAEALHALYGPDAAVEVLPEDVLHPDPPGKFRLTRALFPIDADALLAPGFAPPAAPV